MKKAYVPILIIQFILMVGVGVYAAVKHTQANASFEMAEYAQKEAMNSQREVEFLRREAMQMKQVAERSQMEAVAARAELEKCLKVKR